MYGPDDYFDDEMMGLYGDPSGDDSDDELDNEEFYGDEEEDQHDYDFYDEDQEDSGSENEDQEDHIPSDNATEVRGLHLGRPGNEYFSNSSIENNPKEPKDDIFPYGYNRQDYYDNGMNDSAIDYLGLNQPGAPAPGIAGIVLSDWILGKGGHGKK